jgi:sphingomyelin phosphodiesterase acid-like 3
MRVFHAILISLICLVTFAQRSWSDPQTSAEVKFVVLSDLHFNPFLKSALSAKMLENTNFADWKKQFERKRAEIADNYGYQKENQQFLSDSSYFLFLSVLTNMQQVCPAPTFILLTGDMVAHSFKEQCAKVKPQLDPELALINCERFVLYMFNSVYGSQQAIFPVIGNNDTPKHDYPPRTNFLKPIAELWKSHVSQVKSVQESFKKSFEENGSYIVSLPSIPQCKLLVFNSSILVKSSPEEYTRTLTWLGDNLSTNTCWLACHIPPGYNSRDGEPLWQKDALNKFVDTLSGYGQPPAYMFCGHTHRDEFRLVYGSDKKAKCIVHVAPSISPCYNNNPAYQVFTADTNGTISGFDTIFPTNFRAMNNGNSSSWASFSDLGWTNEYSFRFLYGGDYSVATFEKFAKSLENEEGDQFNNYKRYFTASFGSDAVERRSGAPTSFTRLIRVEKEN